jgi:hypothetical protein
MFGRKKLIVEQSFEVKILTALAQSEYGVDQQVYEVLVELLERVEGSSAADNLRRRVKATDGQFYVVGG